MKPIHTLFIICILCAMLLSCNHGGAGINNEHEKLLLERVGSGCHIRPVDVDAVLRVHRPESQHVRGRRSVRRAHELRGLERGL